MVLLLRCFLFNGIPGSLSQSDPELVLPASGQERTFRRWLLTERICSIEKLKNRRDYLHDFSQNFRYFKTRTIISPSSSSSFSFFLLFLIVVREEEKKEERRRNKKLLLRGNRNVPITHVGGYKNKNDRQ